ncbi:MAG TPA: amino acid adenylation domain-containing protein [Solirubrobacteraceae bacterium]|jgi:amino acid adenylation domain-containing protein|nr:amino acid adenylation domain-containing protein [Solirubrobacteraceae bacterium]
MPAAATLWEAFRRAAARTPRARALSDVTSTYTYAELQARATALAGSLARAGVQPSDTVIFAADRTADATIGLLAIAAAGAVPVPVDVESPGPRLQQVVAASGAACAVADGVGAQALAGAPLRIVGVGDTAAPHSSSAGDRSSLAYVLFTSGSTGVPKGVELTHGNFLSLLAGADRWDEGAPPRVWASTHAFTFDVSVWEMWRPLTGGGELFMMPRAAQVDADLAYELLAERSISVACQTPTALRLLANRVSERGPLPALTRMFIGGERLDFATLEPFRDALASGSFIAWNVYAPTETTVYSTAYRITAEAVASERRSLLGRALPHVRVTLRDVDEDGVGEVVIAGDAVARGYRGDPELTAARFGTDGAMRTYLTGDLARDTGDGVLEFVGRKGGYVKVRGFRVERGEVVAAVCAHPAVDEAAVSVVDVMGAGDSIVVGVVPRPGATVGDLDLRRHLSGLLPAYMRPSRIVFLDRLPRLPSAKLDQRAVDEMLGREAAAGVG